MIQRSWLPLLPVLSTLALGACGGGGCGEEPRAAASGPQAQTASGHKAGGGTADLSGFDSAKGAAPGGGQAPAKAPGAAPDSAVPPPPVPPAPPPGPAPVRPADWDAEVLHGRRPALVMVAPADCPSCALPAQALEALSRRTPQVSFRRLDPSDPQAPQLLPPGLAHVTPSFALYDGGKAVTSRGGLPFPRAAGETDDAYVDRLYRWFRDALSQRDLRFGRRAG